VKALDTNVLVRFLVCDDELQATRVKRLLEEAEKKGEQVLVTIPVLLETLWVLESSYDCSRTAILDALEQLTLTPVFRFEERERINRMIRFGREESLALADLLIGLTALEAGCEATLTFDKQAAKSDLFELLS
jgi:predicted nucleic-acid-binding protein